MLHADLENTGPAERGNLLAEGAALLGRLTYVIEQGLAGTR
jgi:hypothetical protein